jgi:6-phosphogluconolactonase
MLRLAAASLAATLAALAADQLVFFGTYTNQDSKGIYVSTLDTRTGALAPLELAGEIPNPAFLAVHPNGKFLYAANEVSNFEGQRAGSVSAFAIEAGGRLRLLNRVSSGGPGPCHLNVDRSGRALIVANYGGGSVSAYPVRADGTLGPAASFLQHEGKSVNPKRQEAPHAHSVNISADSRYAFVADLGADKIFSYRLDAATAKLTPNDPPSVSLAPGAGPRHFAFHPGGRFAYSINELLSTITAFAYDAKVGSLKEIETVSTLPAGFSGTNYTAEVVVHPSGKFLYGSNRGDDSLALFRIDARTGKLTAAGHSKTQGQMPRNFNIDPSGGWLLAANQRSNNLVVFRIDPASGALSQVGAPVSLNSPVCIRFLAH